jgi:plastocyanin
MRLSKSGIAALAIASLSGIALAAGTAAIDQKGLSFSQALLTVAKGTKVVFTNSDATTHNILINGSGMVFNSGLQRPGVAFTAPFRKEGTYQVTCGIHPKMKMTVIVK